MTQFVQLSLLLLWLNILKGLFFCPHHLHWIGNFQVPLHGQNRQEEQLPINLSPTNQLTN